METAKDLNFGSDERDAGGAYRTARCGQENKGSGRNAQAPVWWRAFSHR